MEQKSQEVDIVNVSKPLLELRGIPPARLGRDLVAGKRAADKIPSAVPVAPFDEGDQLLFRIRGVRYNQRRAQRLHLRRIAVADHLYGLWLLFRIDKLGLQHGLTKWLCEAKDVAYDAGAGKYEEVKK